MSLANLYLVLAVGAGIGVAIQAVVNARLRLAVGSPLWAAAMQSLIGVTSLIAVSLLTRQPLPVGPRLALAPWWAWAGGLLGAVYVAVSILVTPRLGAALMLAAIIVGQLAGALLIDHYGWFGASTIPMTPTRLLGAALLVAGVVLMRWSQA